MLTAVSALSTSQYCGGSTVAHITLSHPLRHVTLGALPCPEPSCRACAVLMESVKAIVMAAAEATIEGAPGRAAACFPCHCLSSRESSTAGASAGSASFAWLPADENHLCQSGYAAARLGMAQHDPQRSAGSCSIQRCLGTLPSGLVHSDMPESIASVDTDWPIGTCQGGSP